MKIVYSGGYFKYVKESVAKSMFYRYADVVNEQIKKGKKVVSINFAKPDYYYSSRLEEIFGGNIISLDRTNKETIIWSEYDIIFIPGGDQMLLRNCLINTGFSLDKLKEDVVIIGDSAGAYIMGAYFPAQDGKVEALENRSLSEFVEFVEKGFYPESKILVIAHINNKRYVPDSALELAKKLASELGVSLLALEENEEKLLDENGQLVNFRARDLFA